MKTRQLLIIAMILLAQKGFGQYFNGQVLVRNIHLAIRHTNNDGKNCLFT